MTHPARLPANEGERLRRLRALAILDSKPEEMFDALVRAAAVICDTPISLVSLIDAERQWFKANVGLPEATETPRDIAFCSHVILSDGVMEVPDATTDPRFANTPLVTDAPGIRFYAGAPLRMSDGSRIGTLCVIGREAKRLSEHQLAVLQHLANAIVQGLEFRERALNALAGLARLETHQAELYAATPAMLHSTNIEGYLIAVSNHWLSELGYAREEVLGRRSSDFLTPESREHAATVLQEFFRTGRCDYIEYQMVRKDGVVIDVLLSAILERDEHGKALRSMAVVRNVTARKRADLAALKAQQQLADATRKFHVAAKAAHVGIWEWDIPADRLIWDEQMFELYGIDPTSFKGSYESWTQGLHPDDAGVTSEYVLQALRGEKDFDCDFRVLWPDAQTRYLKSRATVERDSQGGPIRMLGTCWDVTDQRVAEQALRKSRSFLEKTGKLAGIGGWEVDLVAGSIHWSDQTCELHGVPAGYVPSLDEAIEFYPQTVQGVVRKAIEDAITFNNPIDMELPFISRQGRALWVRSVGAVEYDKGKPVKLSGAFQDITPRKEMERRLAESHELLQVTLDSIGDAVITTDLHGRIEWLNPVAERLTGWTKKEARGRILAQVFVILHEETRKPTPDPVANCLAQGKIVGLSNHTILISRDGTEYGIEDSAAPIRDASGNLHGAVLVFHDVSEQRRLSGEMSHRATHDALTGLVNRAEFESRLERFLANARTEQREGALMYIDLDQFKLVNDACGHSIGDQLLRQVSTLLQSSVRGRDTVARLGGDEFGIILEHCDSTQALRIAEKICDQMEEFRFLHDGRRFRVGTSIGLVPLDERWANMTLVMQAADSSCYAAKEAGRNRVHAWFDTDRAIKARHGEMQWVTRLEQALDENRFELFGQRIVPIGHPSAGIHFEVLLRLREADGSIVPPGVFLAAAERFHMATRIDRWVVRAAFEWLENAHEANENIELISINLSGQSIGDRAFHQYLIDKITQAKFDICTLCFEITETAAITNMGDAKIFIDEVRRLGAKIALDDFGAGASSFGYLKTLPVDFLKIDGQFITDLLEDRLDNAAVKCFHDVAKIMGIKTIAEFVERKDVLDALQTIGIDMAQGYLIHRPEPLSHCVRHVCM